MSESIKYTIHKNAYTKIEIPIKDEIIQNPSISDKKDDLRKEWSDINEIEGTLINYPRPQGRLPQLDWGLTEKANKEMIDLYNKVLY